MPDALEAFDVLCYGTISVENVIRVPYLPSPKRDVSVIHEYTQLGGEALGVAIPLSAWGLRVLVAGNLIGTDGNGQFIVEQLKRYPGIDTRYIKQHENVATPFSRILVTSDGERGRVSYWYDQPPKVEVTEAMMRQARVLSVDAYGRDERDRAAAVARRLSKLVITADAIWPQYPLASLSDVVIISRGWLQNEFPGVYEYDHALDLQAQGAGVIMITDGARPVLVVRADGAAFGVEPYAVGGVVDASRAGDIFKAGILYSWLQPDWPLELKVKFACAAAGLSCQREGGNTSSPTLEEIAALMHSQPQWASDL